MQREWKRETKSHTLAKWIVERIWEKLASASKWSKVEDYAVFIREE